jgi:hypothetical protein
LCFAFVHPGWTFASGPDGTHCHHRACLVEEEEARGKMDQDLHESSALSFFVPLLFILAGHPANRRWDGPRSTWRTAGAPGLAASWTSGNRKRLTLSGEERSQICEDASPDGRPALKILDFSNPFWSQATENLSHFRDEVCTDLKLSGTIRVAQVTGYGCRQIDAAKDFFDAALNRESWIHVCLLSFQQCPLF